MIYKSTIIYFILLLITWFSFPVTLHFGYGLLMSFAVSMILITVVASIWTKIYWGYWNPF